MTGELAKFATQLQLDALTATARPRMLAAHSSGTSRPVTGPAPNANVMMYSSVPPTCEQGRMRTQVCRTGSHTSVCSALA